MEITKAYKTELDPNNKQITFFHGCFGLARFAYNWGLETKIAQYKETGKSDGWMALGKKLVERKKDEFQWMYNYPNWVHVYALKHLDEAYNGFFRRVKSGNAKAGFPKFKSKKTGYGSFCINGSAVKVSSRAVKLPKIGSVRLKEKGYIPSGAEIICATVSEDHGRYYISVAVKENRPDYKEPENIIGIDLGIKTLAVTSDGVFYENPKNLRNGMDRIKRLQRAVSRKQKGSANRKKAVEKLAKEYRKVNNKRSDAIHNLTTELTRTKSVLSIENLNVSGMTKNHHLSQAVSDASFAEIRRQLEYKSTWNGSEVYLVDRFYASSKTCSKCGVIHDDLKLSDRKMKCECGLEIDRDLNAAINLKKYAEARRNISLWRGDGKTNSITVGSLEEVGSEQGYP